MLQIELNRTHNLQSFETSFLRVYLVRMILGWMKKKWKIRLKKKDNFWLFSKEEKGNEFW